MSLHYRRMRASDVRECVALVATHPILGARYGAAQNDLRPAWLRLLSADRFCSAVVFEEDSAGERVKFGVGCSVFVSDEFMRAAKEPPGSWMGPELARRVARGDDSALLSPQAVRAANAHGGLNLYVWSCGACTGAWLRVAVWDALMEAFMDEHQGYLLKEVTAHAESLEHLAGMGQAGGLFWRDGNGYGPFPAQPPEQILRQPHFIGLTRELAEAGWGNWIGALFRYFAPRFGFSPSEQRLLQAALAGGTDEQLSDLLTISVSGVKKAWRGIYGRVLEYLPPELAGPAWELEEERRGPEKKHLLLAYLRQHPEELRPTPRGQRAKGADSPVG